jgi:hypothetical protein
VAAGQAVTCSKSIKDLPEIRGLKLGMPADRFYDVVPEYRQFGFAPGRSYARFIQSRHLRGIRGVKSSFFEDKLFSFSLIYAEQVKSDSIGAFRRKLIRDLGLPRDTKWRSLSERAISLECKDFIIDASIGPRIVYLEDTDAIARRRELGPNFH